MKTNITNESRIISSVSASRLAIFWPSLKKVPVGVWEGENKWGKYRVEGKLSQTHRTILDSILAFHIVCKRLHNEDDSPGGAVFIVNPYEITNSVGMTTRRDWFKNVLADLKQASIMIVINGREHHASIVSEYEDMEEGFFKTMPDPKDKTRATKVKIPLMRITISSAWLKILDETLVVHYAPLVRQVARLKSGISQSLVRLMLTHQQSRCKLDEALKTINVIRPDMTRQGIHIAKKTLMAEAKKLEEEFGIFITKNQNNELIVYYKQHDNVRFESANIRF